MACNAVPDGLPTSPSNPGKRGITTYTRNTAPSLGIKNNNMRYGAPTLISMWVEFLWDTMLCHWVTVYWHFVLIFKVFGVHSFIILWSPQNFKQLLHSFKTWGNSKSVTQHINLKTWILKTRIRQPEIGQICSTHSKRSRKRSVHVPDPQYCKLTHPHTKVNTLTHLCARTIRLQSVSPMWLRTDILCVAWLMKNWFSIYT